ncbi:MAG TPA: TULIP family P47-like protein [Aquabacterium sp.]|nr:TULIP family P47-like protein [Quisquiliibacterium sp.]HQC96605.1 TULIP family P47-like protein [Aquabacterium sp.]
MTTTVSTNNWDTAFGIKFKDANAAILKAGSSPANFSGSHVVPGATYQVSADFGAWQMTGGSGSFLLMTLPLTGGKITGGSQPETAFSGSVQIQVSLGFLPQPSDNTKKDLRLDTSAAVSVLSIDLATGPQDAAATVKGALQDWLNSNLGDFNHVFAAVDLNVHLDQPGKDPFDWVKPTQLGYAIHTDGIAAVDDCIFGVLAMTEGREGINLSPVIDPGIIPTGCDAGFLIAGERLIDKIFAPHIHVLFADASASDFDTQDDGLTLVNVKTLKLSHLTLKDGSVITDATIAPAGFSLWVGSGYVEIDFTGLSFTWDNKYKISVNYRSINSLATDKEGHLQLVQTSLPKPVVTVTKTEAQKWKEIWESIGISVGVAIIGACLGAAAEAGLAKAAASSATEGAINGASEGASEGMIELELVSVNEAIDPQAQLIAKVSELEGAVASLTAPAAPQTFTGLFRTAAWKLLGLVIGAVIGSGVAGIVTALQAYADENSDEMPTLDGFSNEATKGVDWAESSGYRLASAQLRGAMQLGLVKEA